MVKHKTWTARKTLIVETRYECRRDGFKWGAYETMHRIVSRWKQQGINAHAVKWYLGASEKTLKLACREVRK